MWEIPRTVIDLLRDGTKRFSGAARLRFNETARRCRATGLLHAADLMMQLADALTLADAQTDSINIAVRNLLTWTTKAQHARVETGC